MTRRALLLTAAVAVLVACVPAAAQARYHPRGAYLDYAGQPLVTDSPRVRVDAHGVPTVLELGRYEYNPVTVEQYGLQAQARFARHGGARWRHAALAMARWLVRHQAAGGKWLYHFDFPVAGIDATLTAPWASAMGQGQAFSLLARAYRMTGYRKFLRAAVRGLAPLTLRVPDGGLVARLRGHAFYEEYPTRPPSFALNGFMFTLLGLYDLQVAAPASNAGRLFARGMRTLRAELHLYDVGGISAYHLGYLTDPPQPIHRSLYYHWVHVQLLTALDSVAPSRVLRHYRDKWARYRPTSS